MKDNKHTNSFNSLIALILLIVFTLGMTGSIFAGTSEDDAADSELDFTSFTTITTTGVVDEPLEFYLLPDGYNTYDTQHRGTTEIVHYTTDVYEDGVTYEKFCRVYLPYGYDAEDKDTRYNVLYYQHGNNGSPNELFDHDLKSLHALNLLDNLFDPDHQAAEPMIIICTTYYMESDETAYTTPADSLAGDGFNETDLDPANFYREVVESIIPQVESRYNVYCEDFSEEGIKASRDHRAWAGYSRGSVCTWYMFRHDMEYFRYFVPMSAPCRMVSELPEDSGVEEVYTYLKDAIDEHPGLDFFIYATAGGPDDKGGTHELANEMQEEITFMAAQKDTFSFGNDPATDNLYFIRNEFRHNSLYMPYSLYNAATVLFK